MWESNKISDESMNSIYEFESQESMNFMLKTKFYFTINNT
jgi:hypothetical protein